MRELWGNFAKNDGRTKDGEKVSERRVLLTVALVCAAVLVFACSERDSGGDDDGPDGPASGDEPYTGAELAANIQAAVDKEGAYTIDVRQENLVLPRWGGSDGGKVTVGREDGQTIAVAELRRTGDGDYDLWLRNDQTYFKRSTCNQMARVPGGTGDVLEPFDFLFNHRFQGASNPRAAPGRTVLMMEMEGWGAVEVSFDPQTFLPRSLSALNATNNGKALLWEFRDWGKSPEVEPSQSEFDKAYDRGPGGNPC
jgi:hypothetical protein